MKLINVSGEPTEYGEGGFIYEFPFPSTIPTEVPDEIAEKLLISGNYKEFKIEKEAIKITKKTKKGVDTNAI